MELGDNSIQPYSTDLHDIQDDYRNPLEFWQQEIVIEEVELHLDRDFCGGYSDLIVFELSVKGTEIYSVTLKQYYEGSDANIIK